MISYDVYFVYFPVLLQFIVQNIEVCVPHNSYNFKSCNNRILLITQESKVVCHAKIMHILSQTAIWIGQILGQSLKPDGQSWLKIIDLVEITEILLGVAYTTCDKRC